MKPTRRDQMNRTGLTVHPDLAKLLIAGARSARPSSDGDATASAEVRTSYAEESEPIGSLPSLADDVESIEEGGGILMLADKIGERLAFERSGVRLYDALLSKLDAYGSWDGGPDRGDLEHIRTEEKKHFLMLRTAAIELGADPTAVTPSANLHGVASMGFLQVLTDPRTTLQQGLEMILAIELIDNECWTNLAQLASANGLQDLAERCNTALDEEEEHLTNVRSWVASALAGETMDVAPQKPSKKVSRASKPSKSRNSAKSSKSKR
jgi:hypothetical protein